MAIIYIFGAALYIYLLIMIIRGSNAAIESNKLLKNMAYRDTARFVSEVRRGLILQEDEDRAQNDFN